MYKIVILIYFALPGIQTAAQPHAYTVANAHAHNDYENQIPFHMAYGAGFGSIEADIFLQNDELFVAHDPRELQQHRTLEKYYLSPLLAEVQNNHGHPFPDSSRTLQMLIDIKTDPVKTLNKLIGILESHPLLINSPGLRWVITGNRPDPSHFPSYPAFIFFDGELKREYSREVLPRIAMMSADFKNFSQWDGKEEIPELDEIRLKAAVHQAHLQHKPVRFWDAPDFKNAWYELMLLEVDFINTDHIDSLSKFLEVKQ